jgi:nicotinamidase-related amidase
MPGVERGLKRTRPHIYSEARVRELAERAYHSNPDFKLRPERSALLVIDMQDEFVRPGWAPFWVPEATRRVPRIKRLISFCRRNGIPVIFTAFGNTNNYLDRPKNASAMPNWFRGEPQNPSWFRDGKIWKDLAPSKGEVVLLKSTYSAFRDTPLENILKRLGRDTIIICGTLTNYCCGTTAREGYERGFDVVVGSDVTASDLPEMHEAELRTLRKGFAMVLDSNQIIRQIQASIASGTK